MIGMYKLSLLAIIFVGTVLCLPVQQTTKKPETSDPKDDVAGVLEYERYLKEVVEALESDPEFRRKLEKAPEADIRSGKIAQELDYVSHKVRSQLDEIKRKEIDRLRALATKQYELSHDIDRVHLRVPEHLDHRNDKFEIDDLKKLIFQTSKDLAEADRKRREEFKEYEMQKEFEKQSVLNEMDDESRKKYEEELKKQKEKHEDHPKVHHPGNKAQLEEVWEKQDHMDGVDFDPKAFFQMHDVDNNGFWDEIEVKALFAKELDKVYNSGAPEDDIKERAEEMERMREHVFDESDTNHDGLISFDEFMQQTKRAEFQTDPEWETVDKVPQFTHEEYLEFERRRQEEIQRMIAQGLLPPHPNMPHGYYPRHPPQGYQQVPPGGFHPQQVQINPNQQYVVEQQNLDQQHFQQQQQQQQQQYYQQRQQPQQRQQQQPYQSQQGQPQQRYQPPQDQQQQRYQPPQEQPQQQYQQPQGQPQQQYPPQQGQPQQQYPPQQGQQVGNFQNQPNQGSGTGTQQQQKQGQPSVQQQQQLPQGIPQQQNPQNVPQQQNQQAPPNPAQSQPQGQVQTSQNTVNQQN